MRQYSHGGVSQSTSETPLRGGSVSIRSAVWSELRTQGWQVQGGPKPAMWGRTRRHTCSPEAPRGQPRLMLADDQGNHPVPDIEEIILSILSTERPLSIREIAERIGKTIPARAIT